MISHQAGIHVTKKIQGPFPVYTCIFTFNAYITTNHNLAYFISYHVIENNHFCLSVHKHILHPLPSTNHIRHKTWNCKTSTIILQQPLFSPLYIFNPTSTTYIHFMERITAYIQKSTISINMLEYTYLCKTLTKRRLYLLCHPVTKLIITSCQSSIQVKHQQN